MNQQNIEFYRKMVAIRHFEEIAIECYKEGLLGGSYHSYVGQEAVAVGVCSALQREDYITTTYRGRGQHLAKGADPVRLFAELFGRTEGYCRGKGGPMHIADRETGILGANGIVGAGVPITAGAALSAQMSGDGRVSVAFFGDGAMNQGVVSETFNLAALWNLPAVFICENNLYAEMTPLRDSVKNQNLTERVAGFGIKVGSVDGNDVEAVFLAAKDLVEHARQGGGPVFLEANTYRLHGHMFGDSESYRSKEEVAEWRLRDPIVLCKQRLLAEIPGSELDAISKQIREELEHAAEKARQFPEPTPDEIETDVF
jgi:TPP-dependent pyruvate/acetoin dehydrogenase alpha subunit